MGVSTSPATGARGQVVIGEETSFGVSVQPTHILDFTSESLSASENVLESESIREDRGRHKLIRGTLDIQGDISFEQASAGYGMLIRHALGDYVKCNSVDGGIRARQGRAAVVVQTAVDGATERESIVLAEDASGQFPDAGRLAYVYRDTNNTLQFNDNSSAGWLYDEMNLRATGYIVNVNAASTGFTGYSATSVVAVTIAPVYDADGNVATADFNGTGGVAKISPTRDEYNYFEAEDLSVGATMEGSWAGGTTYAVGDVVQSTTDGLYYIVTSGGVSAGDDTDLSGGSDTGVSYDHYGTVLYLHPDSITAHGNPSVNDFAIGLPCITKDSGGFSALSAPTQAIGSWIYEFDATYGSVYTHHIERGRELPTGLTVEVNRDAAVFLYAGCKVNTLTLNFETNSIVTGTCSLVGRQEYAMARLTEDVVPGASSITMDAGEAFPDSGTLTIGEETDITYSAKVDNGDGTFTLTITETNPNNSAAIQRAHFEGENVDSRTTTAVASPYEGNASPLTSFETLVYMDGYFEEVLSATVTLNNNLNTDKFGLGSRFRLQTVEQRATVEASLSLEFDDGKHYKKFMNAEFFSLEFKCVSEADDSEIGTTGVLSQAYYYLPKCKFDGSTPNIEGDSYITHDMPITAVVDDDLNTTDLVIILVNDQTEDVVAA